MNQDHNYEARLAQERYRKTLGSTGYGHDAAGRPTFGSVSGVYGGPRDHQAQLDLVSKAAAEADAASNAAARANYERDSRDAMAAMQAQREHALRVEVYQRKEEKKRYEREMRLREKESFGRNWANQTIASGAANMMNSVPSMMSGAAGGGGGGGGVQTTLLGSGGQRIGGGSVSPLRSLVG
jgi:hypothetical protein